MDYRRTVTPLRHKRAHRLAKGLGWFSLGLGVAEVLAPRLLARALGLHGYHNIVRAYGVREIVTGIAILVAKNPAPYVWARVVGDVLDLTTLGAGFVGPYRRPRGAAIGLGAVVGVAALDVFAARNLSAVPQVSAPQIDYSDRSGLPRAADAMRGAASDFDVPRDFRAPPALRQSPGAPAPT